MDCPYNDLLLIYKALSQIDPLLDQCARQLNFLLYFLFLFLLYQYKFKLLLKVCFIPQDIVSLKFLLYKVQIFKPVYLYAH